MCLMTRDPSDVARLSRPVARAFREPSRTKGTITPTTARACDSAHRRVMELPRAVTPPRGASRSITPPPPNPQPRSIHSVVARASSRDCAACSLTHPLV